MATDRHTIQYAAPAHLPPPRVECSCGWSTVGSDAAAHENVLKELLTEWLEHAVDAEAVNSKSD